MRVGLVGAGFISSLYLQALTAMSGVQLVLVADPDPHALAALRGVPTSRDPEEVLSNPTIDCSCLLTPHYLHGSQALTALRSGQHVVTEKPLALSIEEADRLVSAAKAAKRQLIVRQYLRSAPFVGWIAACLGGLMGRAVSIGVEYRTSQLDALNRPGQWRGTWKLAGGGVLVDLGIHAIDLLRFLFGELEIRACEWRRARTLGEDRADDVAVVIGDCGGALARIFVTNCDTSLLTPIWRWEILCECGAIEAWGDWNLATVRHRMAGEERVRTWESWWEEANRMSIESALRTAAEPEPDLGSALEARANLDLVLRAYRLALPEGGGKEGRWP